MQKNNILKLVKEYVLMSIALASYVFGWTAFLIPNQVPGGGVTGMSTILNYAFGFPISYSYLIINVFLLVMGTVILGRGFGAKTIYCILISTVYFEIFPHIPWVSNIDDNIINAIIGGALSGAGIALVFTQGGSTGGIDIIALVINKYHEIAPGRVFMVSDFLIISSILILPGKSIQDIVYGYIEVIAFSYTVDTLLTGTKQSVQMLVITRNFSEMADRICYELDKGVTAITSMGWYEKEETKMLMIVTRKGEMPRVMSLIKEVDPKAFFTVSSVMGVYGQGFEEIKQSVKKTAGKLASK